MILQLYDTPFQKQTYVLEILPVDMNLSIPIIAQGHNGPAGQHS